MTYLMRPARVFVIPMLFLLFAAVGTVAHASRVALVIGNANYQDTVPLANPRNDAEAVADALRELGFVVFDGYDLARNETEDLIRQFARDARDADTALLFYAGHGLEVAGINYLVPVDARIQDEADLKFETINLADIMALMEREERTNLIFLDACRDNPMAGNLARNMGTRSSAIGRGLARVDTGVGTMIAYATQPGNVALDGAGRHSPFTEALLAHIATPELDVEIMMRRVRRDVMQSTGGRQVPWSSSSLTGSFIFQSPPAPPVVAPQESVASLQNPDILPTDPVTSPPQAEDRRNTEAAPQRVEQIAMLPPPTAADEATIVTNSDRPVAQPEIALAEPAMSERDLARLSQAALNRLGCNAGLEDGIWGRNSRHALERLAEHASTLQLASLDPSEDLLRQMEALDGRVCPLICAATEDLVDGTCVRKTCPSGQQLSSKGACYTPKASTARSNTTPRSSGTSSRSKSCFTYNGQRYCQ